MPQFDKFGIGALVLAATIVFFVLYFLFKIDFEVLVKRVQAFRDRLKKAIKRDIEDLMYGPKANGGDYSLHDPFLKEKTEIQRKMFARLFGKKKQKSENKSESSDSKSDSKSK